MNGHLSSFSSIVGVSDTLVDDLVDIVPSPVMDTLLTILSIDQIFRLETGRRPHDACSLTEWCHVERDFTFHYRKKYLVPWPLAEWRPSRQCRSWLWGSCWGRMDRTWPFCPRGCHRGRKLCRLGRAWIRSWYRTTEYRWFIRSCRGFL